MLQARLDTEQFNTLPMLISTDRLSTALISTDRPDSSQLVDLHVYFIPKNVWKDVQNLAQNEAMSEAISAGFVRVPPNMKIRDLRTSIEQVCGSEDYFPREFIFLRSVGRCLTRVKPKQENELKVKNYRPPLSYAPEIYLLEGRHDDYAHLPTSSPALSSSSRLFPNRQPARQDFENQLLPTFNGKPLRTGRNNYQSILPNGPVSQLPSSSGRQSWTKLTNISSDIDENPTRDFSKLKEEQERLRRRQAELERLRRAAEERRVLQSEQTFEEERRRPQQTNNFDQRRIEQEQIFREQQQRFENERRRQDEEDQRRAMNERRHREQQEQAATTIQASYRGFRQRQLIKQRQRSDTELELRSLPPNNDSTLKTGKIHRFHHSERKMTLDRIKEIDDRIPTPVERPKSRKLRTPARSRPNQFSSRSSSISSTTEPDFPSIHVDPTENVRRTNSEQKNLISSPSPSVRQMSPIKFDRKSIDLIQSPTIETQETIKTGPFFSEHLSRPNSVEQKPTEIVKAVRRSASLNPTKRKLQEKVRRKSSSELNPEEQFIATEIETERLEADARRRRQIEEEEQRRQHELDERRRREALRRQQRDDPESLRARLKELRDERAELERNREEIIRHLKTIHHRITLKRKEARDLWKKKYFAEKKKMPPLEEKVEQLKSELNSIHQKTIFIIEAEAKHAAQTGNHKESQIGNNLSEVLRNNHEISDVRHQIEQIKLRLTTDIKLRNQAENECRTLRHELNQAKMNLNHIKARTGA